MLKLTYTETGLHLERVKGALEALVARRVLLALRVGHSLYIETGRAAFMIAADAPELPFLQAAIRQEGADRFLHRSMNEARITLAPVDAEFVEVSLLGIWIAASAEAHEGTFVTVMGDRLEFLLYNLWQTTQTQVPFLS